MTHAHKIIKLPEVLALTGKCKSSIYAEMKTGTFPSSISLGGRSIGWIFNDVQEWIQARIDESNPDEEGRG